MGRGFNHRGTENTEKTEENQEEEFKDQISPLCLVFSVPLCLCG
jgi:hypothetical protein